MSQFSSAIDKEPLLAVSAPWVSLLATLTWRLSPSQPAGGIYSQLSRTCLIPTEFGTVPLLSLVPKCSQEWPQFPLWLEEWELLDFMVSAA